MNNLPNDIISHIGEFVIDEDTTCYTIHKYMFINAKIGKIFGRKYLEFIENTKKTSDINYKIIRFIHKKSVKYNPVYKQLENDMVKLQLPQIIFENKTARERHVIYMYAIYYGYIWYDESYNLGRLKSKYDIGVSQYKPIYISCLGLKYKIGNR